MTINATYNGDAAFEDKYLPVPSKSEWGMDMITRTMAGSQPNLAEFINSLSQGNTYVYLGAIFYLQTWACNNDLVFPEVTMIYKGLRSGIPAAKTSGKMTSSSASLSCINPDDDTTSAVRNFSYFSRESSYQYIASSRPTGPTYGALDVAVTPKIWKSSIVAQSKTDGQVTYNGGNAPAGIVTALTPSYYLQSLMECSPVIGSPYFECTDTVTQMATSE